MHEIKEEFYTARGYTQLLGDNALTASMEDYLEMIYRLSYVEGYTRVNDIANALNVQPPSVSKMIRKIRGKDLVIYEKYGIIKLTEQGKKVGKYLINRHNTLREFLELIGVQENIHKDVEGLEHNVSPATMECIIKFVKFFKKNDELTNKYMTYITKD